MLESDKQRPSWRDFVISVVGLTLSTLFVVWHLRPDLLILPTVTTGGDTASHYYTASWLVNELLPDWRLTGWVPGNYAGYPLFQIYFPLPFVAMAALAPLTGLPVAFKLVTVVGLVALPAASFTAFRLLRFAAPAPALAAVFSVPFLFHEANSMWGGNIASTLAGEFTYSIGTALLVVFAGTLFRGAISGRGWVGNGVLLAAIGLCHAYTLLVAASLGGYLVLVHPAGRRNLGYLVKVGALAFGLMAFWLVPLLGYAAFTTAYSVVWPIRGLTQVFPVVFWPVLAALIVGGLAWAWRSVRGRGGDEPGEGIIDHRVGYLASLIVGSLLLYLAGWKLDVVDMRFLPFVQLTVLLLAAVPVAAAVRRLERAVPARRWLVAAVTLLITVATLGWVQSRIEFTDDWVAWNYGGFERTPGWEPYRAVNDVVARTPSDPRVAYEHTGDHEAAGTVRAFESLPLFSGASTLEGLYMQSTLSSPFVFYIQSEISRIPSCPLLPYHCGRLDPERAAEHLRLFNVSEVIARSETVTDALAASDDFRAVATVPPYTVFGVSDHDGSYVAPLRYEPIVFTGDEWTEAAFAWFKRPGSGAVPLLRAAGRTSLVGDADASSVTDWQSVALLPDDLPMRPLAGDVQVSAQVEPERIRIHTSRPGHPLLVKVSYHPRWHVEGAARVWLASPSFMLVVPDGNEVTLTYGPTAVDQAGFALSVLAGIWVLASIRPRRRAEATVGLTTDWLGRLFARRPLWVPPLLVLLIGAAVATRLAWVDPWVPHRDGLEHFHAGEYEQAEVLFARSIAAGPSSTAAYYSDYYRALCAHRTGQWEASFDRFAGFLRSYPDGELVAESHFRIAEALEELGRQAEAFTRLRQIIEAYPDTQWAGFAAERLTRTEGRP